MGTILSKVVNEEWQKMPWKSWTPPSQVFNVLPSFTIIEWTYRLIALMCLRHALQTKQNTLPIFFSSFICGTFNDIFFMFMPFCDNFWQAQASVMLTPRLPLYIVEMYAVIVYLATITARQFNLTPIPEATLTGLIAHLTYHVYDINGPPNLWWTWHDSDPAISERHYNAPIGSSMWILTYIGLHAFLLRFVESKYSILQYIDMLPDLKTMLTGKLEFAIKLLEKVKDLLINTLQHGLNAAVNNVPESRKVLGWAVRIVFSGLVCTPVFMMLMGIFQILSVDKLGVPGDRTYKLTLFVFIAITLNGFRNAAKSGALYLPKQKSTILANRRLLKFVLLFYAVNIAIGTFSKPENHLSTGVHQRYSVESAPAVDIMGWKREDNLLPSGPVEHSKNDYELISGANLKLHSNCTNVQLNNSSNANLQDCLDRSGRRIIFPEKLGTFSEWYTVVGKERKPEKKTSDNRRLRTTALIGTVVYTAALLNVFSLKSYIP